MRYVIGVCVVTAFLLWDGFYNEGRYVSYVVFEVKRIATMAGG